MSHRAPRVSLVIPTKNESRNIGWVLRRLPDCVDEVVLVDAGSTDGTVEIAAALRPDVRIVTELRPGKGTALRAGFDAARGEVVVMIDADGSMNPAEIPSFVACVDEGYDLAKGSRFMRGGDSTDITRFRRYGHGAILGVVNLVYLARFSDLCYGYMALRRSAIPRLGLRATGFEIETEIVLRAVLADFPIAEVPSIETERRFGTSNLRTIRDGTRVLRQAAQLRFGEWPGHDLVVGPSVAATPVDDIVIDLRTASRHQLTGAGRR